MRRVVLKKFQLACVVAAATLCTTPVLAQSSVTLYGIADAGIRHTNNTGNLSSGSSSGSYTRMVGEGFSQSRVGFNVVEDIGGGLKALANAEMRFNLATGATTDPMWQQSWVGLQSSKVGRLTLGRQYNVLFDLNVTTFASFPYSPYFHQFIPELGYSLGVRSNEALKYTVELGPMRAALQYSNEKDAIAGGASRGGYVRYADGGLAVGAGYLDRKFASGKKLKGWILGGSYRTGAFNFNAGYAVNRVEQGPHAN